jgi:hypothetical protein
VSESTLKAYIDAFNADCLSWVPEVRLLCLELPLRLISLVVVVVVVVVVASRSTHLHYNAVFCYSFVKVGTLGASGDLAPLAHLALGLMGEGKMWNPTKHQWDNAAVVLKQHHLTPLKYVVIPSLRSIHANSFKLIYLFIRSQLMLFILIFLSIC